MPKGEAAELYLKPAPTWSLGRLLNVCRLQGHGISSGLQRRFLFYAATRHGRLMLIPRKATTLSSTPDDDRCSKLSGLSVNAVFCAGVRPLGNRSNGKTAIFFLMQTETMSSSARLNGARARCKKVAMLFEASSLGNDGARLG